MIEFNIDSLDEKKAYLQIPLCEKENWDMFPKVKLSGRLVLGCVCDGASRHYDFKPIGMFFDLYSLYKRNYIDNINWSEKVLVKIKFLGNLEFYHDDELLATIGIDGLKIFDEAKFYGI